MRNGLRNIVRYFSKSSLRTIALLFMALITSLYFNAILNPLSPTISQRIAEDTEEVNLDTEESNFLTLLNTHRKTLGLSELTVSKKLTNAASWMSEDIVETKNLSHIDSLGRDPGERAKEFGYSNLVGENLAEVGPTAQSAYTAWLASEGHKKNMEESQWKVIGIARVQGGSKWYWTTNFGDTLDTNDADPVPTGSQQEENEEQNCNDTTGRDDGCMCNANSQCKANVCTEWKSVNNSKYCGEDPEEESQEEDSEENEESEDETVCKPDERTDSGEFDNACDEILNCTDETGRKGLCLCEENAQCASGVCLPPDEDYDDKRFCKEEEKEQENNPTAGAPIDTTLTFKVTLPGIGTDVKLGLNNTPKRMDRTFTVQFLDQKGDVVLEDEATLSYANGTYQGVLDTTLSQNTYEIKIASDNSLFKTIPGVIQISDTKSEFTLPTVSLITGNISQTDNSQNSLDIFDYNAMLTCFEQSCAFSQKADLNDDGIVDTKDFNILLRGFAIQS